MDQIQPIDYAQMKKDELSKANKVYTFKQASREDLYNNLQVFQTTNRLCCIYSLFSGSSSHGSFGFAPKHGILCLSCPWKLLS